MKKIQNAADLDTLYVKSEEADKADFAKMRSGLMLVAGEHYMKKNAQMFERLRSAKNLDEQVKLRISKNHIGRIARRYSNTIMTAAPGVTIGPKHKRELQDQKAAELNQAIWNDAKEKCNLPSLVMQWADDFVGIGEVWTKLYYDEFAGAKVGVAQAIDETGQPIFDEMGQPVPDESKPVYEGQIRFEEIFAFNVLRDPACQNVKESPYLCIRKAVTETKLKAMFPDHAEKIRANGETPFLVFDVGSGYRKGNEDELIVKEWYIRPCPDYPNGYYYIHTAGVILDEGELPEGIFPIVGERLETIQTKARGMSAIEPLRPFQAEINRCASKIAEHQITLGDDKLIMLNGGKMSSGGQVPGVRGITVNGGAPTILPGRSGAQFLDYLQSEIKGMYDMAELDEEELKSNLEPHTLLYRAASQKRKFSRYINRFELFLKAVCQTYLRMAKVYLTEEAVILAVGRAEQVNISEFKNTNDQSVEIVVEPASEDVETKLGRQLVMQHTLQYVGAQLDPKTLGKILRNMPYANTEEAFSDLTIDDENATNDMLSLDRGELPLVNMFDNSEYLVTRATARQRQSDFKMMSPEIQGLYDKYISLHMKNIDAKKEAALRAQAGFIPDGGALVGIDFFIQDPNNPERTRRARVPYDALDWLVAKLQEQGTFKKIAQTLPESAVARMAPSSPEMAEAARQQPVAGGAQAEVVPPSSTPMTA